MSLNPEPGGIYLEFIGGGFLPGAPARSMSKLELDMLGLDEKQLIASGLYRKVETKAEAKIAEKPKPEANKKSKGPAENKGD
jgi:hypothetical protein